MRSTQEWLDRQRDVDLRSASLRPQNFGLAWSRFINTEDRRLPKRREIIRYAVSSRKRIQRNESGTT
jgi:hypothetical protein